jgi:glutamate/tyrosine decarboxylase-like PLP-dependent enzyme
MSQPIADRPLMQRAFGHALDYLDALPTRFAGAPVTRKELRDVLAFPLTEQGEDGAAVLDAIAVHAARGTQASAGPRYFGFVIGGTYPAALAADWLVSTWDQNPGLFVISPLVSVCEEVAQEWILDLLDLPRESSVGFTTGCQMAHFTGLAAARHGVLRRVGWNVEEDGLYGAPSVNLVISEEAHITVDVALRYLGFGARAAHRVAVDDQGRMRPDELRRHLATLTGPTIVCAQAGGVNSGAVDPFEEIADLAAEHGAWLHVDGAFGLWAQASPKYRHLTKGVERADSWATDGHKWLNVPYDCGIAIVRDSAAHRTALGSRAAYLVQTAGAERDPFEYVPEFSRRGRGVPVYATLRHLGRNGVADLIDRCSSHARLFAKLLAKDDRVQILNEVVLNQVLVRFGNDDDQTRAVISRVQQDGTCWLGGTTWRGQAAMRISVSNWATGEEDVERSAEAILRVAAK